MAKEFFSRWRASIRTLVHGGMWRWALAVGFSVALGGGVWAYDVFGPEIRASWPRWKIEGAPWVRETLLWIEFMASVTLTLTLLCWLTALLFCALCALLFSLPRLLGRFSGRFSSYRRLAGLQGAVEAIVQREQLLGTVLNLLAGVGALAMLTVVLERPLDSWDFGIQIAISAAVELIVLEILFAKGQIGWPLRKES